MTPQPRTSLRPKGEIATAARGPGWPAYVRHFAAWPVGLWAIGVGGAIAAFLWCFLVVPNGTPEAFPSGDGALVELYTLYATRGLWGLGPYSRFTWHHPGPLFFYLLAPFYAASHFHNLALNAGALAINMIALAAIGWCLARYASTALCVSISVALATYLWRLPLLIVSAWNPHTVILPLAALIISSSVVASGRLALLPTAIVAASFVAQTHVALVPSAATAMACALVAGLRHGPRAMRMARANDATGAAGATDPSVAARGRGSGRLWIAVSMVLGLVLWFPVIVEQFTAADGNLSQLARFFLTADPDDGVPLADAITVWTMAMTTTVRPGMELPVGHGYPHAVSVWMVMWTIAGVLLLGVAGWWAARRQRLVDAWCCWVCALLSVGAFAAIARIRGGLADHLVAWVAMIALIGVASLVSECVQTLFARRAAWLVPIATVTLLIGVLASGLVQLERLRDDLVRAAAQPRSPVESVYVGARLFLAKAHVQRPLFHTTAPAWGEAAGIILPLYKRRVPLAVSDDARSLFGPPLAPDGREDADLTIADHASWPRITARDGNCVLIERHGLSLHLLLSSLKTPTSVVCE